jgi:hypothetical protein
MNAPSIASKATVSRADLLRILATQGERVLERTAFAFGYERKLLEPAIVPQVEAVPRFSAQPPQEIKPERIERPSSLPAARFFYVTQRERHGQTTEQRLLEAPEWFEKAKALAHDERPEPSTVRFPAHLPLTRWARLWPFLRSTLGQSYLSRQPGIPRLISKLSNGETVRKLPLRAQHHWSAWICILLDHNRQTLPFRKDFNALCQALKRLRGAVGLEIRILHGEPGIRTYYRQPRDDTVRHWQTPDVQTPLLILSDLGMLAGAPEYLQAWQQLGCRLRAAGCKPIVLCPVPAQYHDSGSQRLFSLHEWDRQSHFQRNAIRQSSMENAAVKGAEILLTLLAPAIVVEPALLRAVRYLLPAAQADVAAEAAVWSHPDVMATTQGFCFGNLVAIEKYQHNFMALDPELKCRLVGLIRSHHAHLPKSLRLAELDVCNRLAPDCLGDPVSKEAKQWKQDMVKTCYQYPDRLALSQWLGRHVARHSQTMWQDNPELAALWALAQRDKLQNGETLELPRHARGEDVLFFLPRRNNPQPRPCILRQRGQELVLEESNALGNQTPDLHNPGSHLANLTLATDGLFVQQEYTNDPQPAPLRYVQLAQFPQVVAEITQDTQRIRLQTTSEVITVENCTKPAWASSIGCDQYGLFADLTVKNVSQRFRWIVPGIFLMGSPEDEPERWAIVPANRCGYIKIRALFTYEVPLCVALKSMTN